MDILIAYRTLFRFRYADPTRRRAFSDPGRISKKAEDPL